MKLWQKIYIIFFSIFVIAFNLGGISIIERIHSTSLENEVKNGLSKQKGISYTFFFAADWKLTANFFFKQVRRYLVGRTSELCSMSRILLEFLSLSQIRILERGQN